MKLKQIALASSLFFSCHLVAIGATYDAPDEQEFNLEDPFAHTSPLGNEPDNLLFDPELSTSQARKDQLKQDYLEILELLKNKQLNAAENKIEILLQQNPNISAFYNLQGLLQASKKENKLAINSFKKSIELAPKNLSSHLGLAAVYISTGELKQAKQYANSALSIDDTSIHAYILLAKIAYQEKRLQDIESILLNAQKHTQGERSKEVLVADNLVKLYILQKKNPQALSVAQDIIKRYPDDSAALTLLANTQIFNQQTAQAISTLEKLTHQESNDLQHRLLLAKLLLKQPQKKQQVLQLLNEINTIAPKNAQVQVQRSIMLTHLKHFPEAFQAAKKVKQLAPDTGLAEALEGEIYLAEKKQGPALAAFKKSYKIKANSKVLSVIVKQLMAQNKQAEAIDFLSQELKKNPKNLTAHFNLGNIYQRQNNNLEAEKHYQAILAEQPDNVVILNNLAWIYHLENNPKALSLAERAYQKAPKSADIADTYAAILVKKGQLAKGLKIFQQASKLAPANYDIQYHLADAYATNGQTQQAIQILKTITQSKQNFSEKQAAVSLLKKLS